ncbi:zf-HC2 domain-containing protein [Lysinibacillus fusiformis]|nr:zf-HC2 domain-containing protein [Lysinibacillus fusiformis]
MKDNIKCTIIQDILPLYADDVVSGDTKELVQQHLKQCEKCRAEFDSMTKAIYLPKETSKTMFKGLQKKWRKKKLIISLLSIFGAFIILSGLFYGLFIHQIAIEVTEISLEIEEYDNNQLVSFYTGRDAVVSVKATHPLEVNVNGVNEQVIFIYYAESLGYKYINRNQQLYKAPFQLTESEKADAVYYAEFDINQISSGEDTWEEVAKRGKLIWERRHEKE